jgi:NTE family protein
VESAQRTESEPFRAHASDGRPPRRALVFSGGGARGAYEAGVVRYLVEELPRRIGRPVKFDIICGTSVGAIHACWMAATAQQDASRGLQLVDFWRNMKIEQVLPFSRRDLFDLARRMIGVRRMGEIFRGSSVPDRIYGVLNTRLLERMVVRAVPWRRIRTNVNEGHVGAVAVAATEIATGRVVVFLESRERALPGWTRDPSVVPQHTHLRPTHALASAAIPLLFPAVRIANTYYADGGLRLNTPLAPALRLGADRVLVVALRRHAWYTHAATLASHRVEDYANPFYLLGKLLNAILLDHMDGDLARMRVMNEMIRDGEQAFGPGYLDRLNEVSEAHRGQRFRVIDDLVIRPSADLGALAAEVLPTIPQASLRSPFFRFAMRGLGSERSRTAESDLFSYLLFDGDFLAPLADLGYRDAAAQEENLVRFFED